MWKLRIWMHKIARIKIKCALHFGFDLIPGIQSVSSKCPKPANPFVLNLFLLVAWWRLQVNLKYGIHPICHLVGASHQHSHTFLLIPTCPKIAKNYQDISYCENFSNIYSFYFIYFLRNKMSFWIFLINICIWFL